MKRARLSDQVVEKIRDDIQRKRYKPGDKIPAEPALMKIYAVGRSTIREAIKSLAMSGILKVQQGAGTFVNADLETASLEQRLQRANFEEINAVRKLLEEEIVSLAVAHHTPAQLAAIGECLLARKEAIAAEDRQACTEADIAFHMAIAHASGNRVLAGLYQHFTATIRSFFSKRALQGFAHFAMSHHLHEDLFKAIKAKRKKAALDIIRHILAHNY
ncbi:transcriptional regulator, GntR family [Chitinophaga costaii]|uniref:Transcriptional regulator, GntR family n=1 Tax=Chitinophaga costaii TaxID=1335309 RepID=A0A1C4G8S5_9BACT|nr:FCD domain-containing protein [Chitinophaga costaii]PUZ19435.1 FadR family transcriptional regulator [Chitinophaga costaii]SCC64161.1 transcriptional regulator, GntR family [Chitinophaga costaii]